MPRKYVSDRLDRFWSWFRVTLVLFKLKSRTRIFCILQLYRTARRPTQCVRSSE